MSILDRFTTHVRRVITRACAVASLTAAESVTPAHLLLGIARERGSLGHEVLAKVRITPTAIESAIAVGDLAEEALDGAPSATVPLSANAQRALEKAVLVAAEHAHRYVGTEHLLAGILATEDPEVGRAIAHARVDPQAIAQHLATVFKSTAKFPELATEVGVPREETSADAKDPNATSKTPALDFFAKDLTAPAVVERLDPVIGREGEIERVIQVLCRRTKNNPILLGDPGVGKTAIVEGLARRIVERDVPDVLIGKRLLALDLALLVAGTIYRGEFESRLKQIIDEVRQDKDLILFIDEVHMIMGAGAASGSLDAANILKPALAKGDIRCIGATTYGEFKKHVEGDAALERRFQSIHVTEPTAEQTAAILRGVKPYYEAFHRVRITDEAIEAAARLAERYLTERRFPDKAIDLVDEAAARLRVHAKNDPLIRKVSTVNAKLEALETEKRKAVATERYADAVALQQESARLRAEADTARTKLGRKKTATTGVVSVEDIAAIVAQTIGIPVAEILLEEQARLLQLEEALRARIIGQDDALRTITAALRRAKGGLATPNRPLASFLLLGPTGVGKTETAKAIAELLFQQRDALIRLDMSEFSEAFTVSKLVGAPAGYVGYREGSKLTDAVRKRPASVILFDEIEKAHPDVWNLLLQILEDGRLTDATGREVSFTNAIIVLTSNVGTSAFSKAGIGFLGGATTTASLADQYREIEADALRELRTHFRPELLNRIDLTIVYRPLTRDHLTAIAQLRMTDLADRLRNQQRAALTVDPAVAAWIAERAFDPASGARAVRRFIQEHLENPIAAGFLDRRFHAGDALTVTCLPDRSALDIACRAPTAAAVPRSRARTPAA